MREICKKLLKETLDYILEDVEDPQLYGMVSLIAREAEKTAHSRRDAQRMKEVQEQQESYRHMMPEVSQPSL